MKDLRTVLLSLCAFITLPVFAQFPPVSYGGLTLNDEANPLTEFWFESPLIVVTTVPQVSSGVMSYENGQPGSISNAPVFASGLLTLNNSQPNASLAMGSNNINDPQVLQVTQAVSSARKHLDLIYVGRHLNGVDRPYAEIILDDTLVVNQLYIAPGAQLRISGDYPMIVRYDAHNKGKLIIENENLWFPVETSEYEGRVSCFEQLGEVIGRLNYEIILNERPEFVNWDWVNANTGSLPTLEDSLSIYGLSDFLIDLWIEYWEGHNEETYNSQQGWLDSLAPASHINSYQNIASPLKGVRYGPGYGDHQRIAIYKDAFIREPDLRSWYQEGFLPDDGNTYVEYMQEHILGVRVSNTLLETITGYPGFWICNEEDADAGSCFNFSSYNTGINLNKINGNIYLPQSSHNYYYPVNDDVAEQFVISFKYVPLESIQVAFMDTNWISNPVCLDFESIECNYLDSMAYIAAADTIQYEFNLLDAIYQYEPEAIFWGYDVDQDLNDPLFDFQALMELDTSLADDTYDYQWFYRDESIAQNRLLNGWRPANASVYQPSYGGWFSGLNYTYFDVEVQGDNGNRMWERPDKSFLIDTIGRNSGLIWGIANPTIADSSWWFHPQPTLEESVGDHPFLGQYVDNYPLGFRAKQPIYSTSNNFWGSTPSGIDASVPVPYPQGMFTYTRTRGNSETIDRYQGYPYMNTLAAYDDPNMLFHPPIPINGGQDQEFIPNLPPNNSGDHMIDVRIPTAADWVYAYAPNGLLYEEGTWSECFLDNDGDTVFSNYENGIPLDTSYVNGTVYCIDYFNGQQQAYTVQDISSATISDLFQNNPGDWDTYGSPYIKRNRWSQFANPVLGYLDMDQVADRYFANYPESHHLEFAWYQRGAAAIGQSNTNAANVQNYNGRFWRRKYHRYGDDIVSDEVQYFCQLLYDQFVAQGGEGFSAELTAALLAFAAGDNTIDPTSPVFNWLLSAPVNPNAYVPLGQYAVPGAGMWVRNSSGSPVSLQITADMGEYNFNFPETTDNEVYIGTLGFGEDGTGIGGRNASNQASSLIAENESSTIVCIEQLNDSSYFPFIILNHRFEDDAENGSDQIFEDSGATITTFPFVYTDSTKFRASNFVREYGPHNQQPLWMHIPQPLDSGNTWIFTPIAFQNTGSQWYDPSQGQQYTRLGVDLYDANGQIQQILYLDTFDELIISHEDDYVWPLEAKIYFTSLVGDGNGDGQVTMADLIDLLPVFNMCEPTPDVPLYDINGDGCVTTTDMLLILSNFGLTIGNEVGDFEGSIFGIDERVTPGTAGFPYEEIKNTFRSTRRIHDVAQSVENNVVTLWGEQISVVDTNLTVIETAYNEVTIPEDGIFWILGDRTLGYFDNDEGDPTVIEVTTTDPGVTDENGAGTYLLPTRAAAYPAGATQFWIDFYQDLKTFDGNFDADTLQAPTLAQIYYGINSGPDTNATGLRNAKINGLIDIFGGGVTDSDMTLANTGGAYADAEWSKAAEGFRASKVSKFAPMFSPSLIPMAFTTPVEETTYGLKMNLKGFETQVPIARKFNGGLVEQFGEFSELSGKREPGVTEWGGDIKTWRDAEVHDGVLAMADLMSLGQYFKFKMYGVSPKFGQTNAGSLSPRGTTESFGSVYNTGGAEGVPNGPGVGFAPSKCHNLADWTQEIVLPFFAANMGQPVIMPTDPTPVTQDGIQRNIDNAGHYEWFTNSAAFVHHTSYGPLVYDFDMNGVWEQADLDIWNGLVAAWTAQGLDVSTTGYSSASYYRPVTDAINEVVNVLKDYDPNGQYEASWKFHSWFDVEATSEPFGYVNNWFQCLNQEVWNFNTLGNPMIVSQAFGGTSTQDDSWLYNTGRTDFNPALLNPTTLNNYGRVAVGDYTTGETDLYQFVPSNNYFPVTKYWHP